MVGTRISDIGKKTIKQLIDEGRYPKGDGRTIVTTYNGNEYWIITTDSPNARAPIVGMDRITKGLVCWSELGCCVNNVPEWNIQRPEPRTVERRVLLRHNKTTGFWYVHNTENMPAQAPPGGLVVVKETVTLDD